MNVSRFWTMIALLAAIPCAWAQGQTASGDDMLHQRVIPDSVAEAPTSLQLPDEWITGLADAYKETKQRHVEVMLCFDVEEGQGSGETEERRRALKQTLARLEIAKTNLWNKNTGTTISKDGTVDIRNSSEYLEIEKHIREASRQLLELPSPKDAFKVRFESWGEGDNVGGICTGRSRRLSTFMLHTHPQGGDAYPSPADLAYYFGTEQNGMIRSEDGIFVLVLTREWFGNIRHRFGIKNLRTGNLENQIGGQLHHQLGWLINDRPLIHTFETGEPFDYAGNVVCAASRLGAAVYQGGINGRLQKMVPRQDCNVPKISRFSTNVLSQFSLYSAGLRISELNPDAEANVPDEFLVHAKYPDYHSLVLSGNGTAFDCDQNYAQEAVAAFNREIIDIAQAKAAIQARVCTEGERALATFLSGDAKTSDAELLLGKRGTVGRRISDNALARPTWLFARLLLGINHQWKGTVRHAQFIVGKSITSLPPFGVIYSCDVSDFNSSESRFTIKEGGACMLLSADFRQQKITLFGVGTFENHSMHLKGYDHSWADGKVNYSGDLTIDFSGHVFQESIVGNGRLTSYTEKPASRIFYDGLFSRLGNDMQFKGNLMIESTGATKQLTDITLIPNYYH